MSLSWKIREMRGTDHALVADSFLRSLTAELPAGACWKCLRRELERHLRSPESICLTAVSEENDDQIFGWSVTNGERLIYVYVREPFRRKGVAYDLVSRRFFTGYANLTEKGQAFLQAIEQAQGVRFVFNP